MLYVVPLFLFCFASLFVLFSAWAVVVVFRVVVVAVVFVVVVVHVVVVATFVVVVVVVGSSTFTFKEVFSSSYFQVFLYQFFF